MALTIWVGTAEGLYAIGDGEGFELRQRGLPEWFGDNIDSLCMAAMGSTVAFGTSDGAVYVSQNEGKEWRLAQEGLAPVRCVALM